NAGEACMRTTLALSVALALMACSPPATQSSDNPEAQTAPETTAVQSAALPQMRLGRWRKVITAMGQQTVEFECVTSADLTEMATRGESSHCTSAMGFQRTAEGLVYEADCTGEDGGGHLRTVMNGDMQNGYVA